MRFDKSQPEQQDKLGEHKAINFTAKYFVCLMLSIDSFPVLTIIPFPVYTWTTLSILCTHV